MASGTADKVKGAVKDAAGKVTGDKLTEAETDKAKGDVNNATVNVTQSAKGARDSLNSTLALCRRKPLQNKGGSCRVSGWSARGCREAR